MSMYLPERFENSDVERSLALMRAHPFATLISTDVSGQPFISHLPLVVERRADALVCIGHMSRANAHWKLLERGVATAIFHGPHAYVTPRWYADNNVPTWNYAVVHALGPATLIEDRDGIVGCLKQLHAVVETGPDAWTFWIPDALAGNLERAIVGFEIRIESFESKFKLSQNRPAVERARVIDGLRSRSDEGSRAVSDLMTELTTSD